MKKGDAGICKGICDLNIIEDINRITYCEVASGDSSFANAKNCAQFFTPGPQKLRLSEFPAGHATELVTSRLSVQRYIPCCARIKKLDLIYCRDLRNVDKLKNMKELKELNLASCTGLQNVEGLNELKNLSKLSLRGCFDVSLKLRSNVLKCFPMAGVVDLGLIK